jgi:DNA primase
MLKPILTPRDIAERYNRCMPDEIRQYLNSRGIAATIIDRQLLGWNGANITIPVFGDTFWQVVGFRYATLPQKLGDSPEMQFADTDKPMLYGHETLARKPHRIVICEEEFDRLLLESHGVPAVALGAGTTAVLPQWKDAFDGVEDIFICCGRRTASAEAAKKVQHVLPNARIAKLPAEVGEGGRIFDYFMRLLHTDHDFEVLLASGTAADESTSQPPQIGLLKPADKTQARRAARLRKRVRLHDVVYIFTNLQASAGRLVSHCPLHDDSSRSFSVHPETDVYSCSVCGAAGDVVMFLMNKESMTFGQALEALERFEITGTIYGAF